MVTTVRIHGLRELNAAFREVDKKLASQLGKDLKEAAEPIAESARGKVTRYQGASVRTIRARQGGARVYVEQGARKVTGKRGDFGALQMRMVLEPALEEKQDVVFTQVERVLERYGASAGF